MTVSLFKKSKMKVIIFSLILSLLVPFGFSGVQPASANTTQGITLTAKGMPGNFAKLTWNSSANLYYNVYYSVSGQFELLESNVLGNSYTTPSVFDYPFTYSGAESISEISFKVTLNISGTTNTSNIAVPTSLALTGYGGYPVSNGIYLHWNSVPDTMGEGYYVYGSDAEGTLYGPPKVAYSNNFISTGTISYMNSKPYQPNKTYYFKIGVIGLNGEVTVLPQNIAVNTGKSDVTFQLGYPSSGYGSWRINDQTSPPHPTNDYVQAVKIKLAGTPLLPSNAGITYLAHIQDYGWTGQGWMSNGVGAGTENQNRRLEAIQIKLVNMPGVHVEYRAKVDGLGWLPWVRDGATAGTTGQYRKMYDLQIRLVYD